MRGAGVLVVLTLAACRSPFAEADESGPPEDPQKVGVGVHGWPLYERAPGSRGVRTDVLWPLTSVRTSPEGHLRRADVLVPIVLWEKDGTRSRFGVRPLFDVETDDAVGAAVEDVDLLFPIVKWRDTPDASRFEVRPFWWHCCSAEWEHDVLVPFGGSWGATDGSEGGWFAGPFAGGSTRTTKSGVQSTDWWALGAAIHETREDEDYDSWKALLGLLQKTTWEDGGEEYAFPLVDHRADASEGTDDWRFLWPGFVRFSREGDEEQDWALPFWYRERNCVAGTGTTVLFPFWFQHDSPQSSMRLLFPLYGGGESGTSRWRSYGGPLLVTSSDEQRGRRAVNVLFPFLHWGEDAAGWDAYAFPFLWIEHSPERSNTHLWPLFGHRRDGTESESAVAWPFFTVESDEDGWTADLPWPLVEIDRRGTHHETRAFPLFSAESDTDTGAYEGNVLWRLSNWEGDGAGKSDFRILWRLVQSTDTGDKSIFAVNPFFRHETNARGDDHWSALFGLVARTREAEDVRWRLLWFLTL